MESHPSTDALTISHLIIPVRIGYGADERAKPQRIQIDLEMEIDFTNVLAAGDLEKGVDYSAIRHTVKEVATSGEFFLLENLGDVILRTIFKNSKIVSAKVVIKKLDCWDDAVPGAVMRRKNG
jgi:FolB domain-containing protein